MNELEPPSSSKQESPVFDATKIFAEVKQSVVAVKRYPAGGKPVPIKGHGGTGFFVSSGDPDSCEVATVSHVTEGDSQAAVVMQNGRVYKAQSELIDIAHQISIYKVQGVENHASICKPVELDITPPKPGERVLGVGANVDPTKPEPYEGTSIGTVSRSVPEEQGWLDLGMFAGEDMNRDVAAFNPIDSEHGDSGGPLFSAKAKVKGLMAAGNMYGFAEMSRFLKEDLDQIKTEREAAAAAGRP